MFIYKGNKSSKLINNCKRKANRYNTGNNSLKQYLIIIIIIIIQTAPPLLIDIANPKTNQKSAGFTKEERESFSSLLEDNKLIDSFRDLYPDKREAYSYWSYRSNARKNNKGW